MNKTIKILVLILLSFTFLFGAYVSDYYHAKYPYEYYVINSSVKITHDNNMIKLSNSDANDTAIIFYPGTKVEYIAYLPLLEAIAKNGYDCYLIKMPLNLAVLDVNAADKVIDNNQYAHYYIAGHSLGGAMASEYAYNNQDKLDGLFLMGTYLTDDFSDTDFLIKEFVGNNDNIISQSKLSAASKYFSTNSELVTIIGGNNSNFGDYGLQANDNEAVISQSKQAKEVASVIDEAIKEAN